MAKLEVVKSIYEAFGRGDIPHILEHLAADVVWEEEMSDGHGLPYLLPGSGRDHAAKFFAALSAIEITRFEPFDFLESRDRVLVLVHIAIRNRATGKVLTDYEAHAWTFDARGQISRFRHILDTHKHVLANTP